MSHGGRSGYDSEEEQEFKELHASLTDFAESDNSYLCSTSASPMSHSVPVSPIKSNLGKPSVKELA